MFNLKKIIYTTGLIIILSVVYINKSHFSKWNHNARDSREGKPFNGGKFSPPVDIKSNLNGMVQSNVDLDLNLEIVIGDDYDEIITRVRGIDGVTLSGELEKRHPAKSQNPNPSHFVSAKLPDGVSGFVVIDVTYTTKEASYSVTKAISLKTKSLQLRQAAQKIETDASGEPIVRLTPEVK
ncbi:MAG: hypothetical protein HY072_09530 [Deltaproteobacteria bacterium]|nr:hypothetical protein [Deltaproteobacteria bacterium]